MHNLNVNLAAQAATAANNLLVESGGTTPRTPEILNSLIAMTNPLDNYQFGDDVPKITSAAVPGGKQLRHNMRGTSGSESSNSSSSSQTESPVGNNPPSVQHTCSQLIKAGLKLTIEQKRKQIQSDGDDFLDLDCVKRFKPSFDCSESEDDKIKQEPNGLTPEDEERRRRRRERNKIAATKCRLKKRERTVNLISESETLETQNIDLKNQLQELRNQERMLREVLSSHRPHCSNSIGPATKDSLYKLPPVSSVMDQHSYGTDFRNQNQEIYQTSTSITGSITNLTYSSRPSSTATTENYSKPPSIIVEDIEDDCYDDQQFINLDTISPFFSGSLCHNNYQTSQTYSNSQGMDNGCMA